MIFPFVETGLQQIAGRQMLSTAKAFLDLMARLRIVALQDAACLMLEKRDHVLSDLIPSFRIPSF